MVSDESRYGIPPMMLHMKTKKYLPKENSIQYCKLALMRKLASVGIDIDSPGSSYGARSVNNSHECIQ